MQDDSNDDGRGKRPRVVAAGSQKMETDQEPQSDLPPVPEHDVYAVNSVRRKRVEVNERKMTESDRNLFRKANELELQSWLDHRVFDLVKKNC